MVNSKRWESKDLRAIGGINLALNMIEHLNENRKQLEVLGLAFVQNDETIRRDVQQLRAIMRTSGNPSANQLLIETINDLEDEIASDWPYDRKIKMLYKLVWKAFKLAVGKHEQRYDMILQRIMIKSMKENAIIEEPKMQILPDKHKRQKRIDTD